MLLPDHGKIAGVCMPAKTVNPANPCEVCDPDHDIDRWKPCP